MTETVFVTGKMAWGGEGAVPGKQQRGRGIGAGPGDKQDFEVCSRWRRSVSTGVEGREKHVCGWSRGKREKLQRKLGKQDQAGWEGPRVSLASRNPGLADPRLCTSVCHLQNGDKNRDFFMGFP